MKTNINTTIFSIIALTFSTLISSMLNAQNGSVLSRISDYSKLELFVNEKNELHANNLEIDQLITSLTITKIEKAFPASRSTELSNVYQISCNCDENDLLEAIVKQGTYFKQPEIAEKPQVLYTPNDYSSAIATDYALNLINAQGAWDITHGDSSIVIAITDANFHYGHEELVGKYNYVSANSSSDYVHGTAVAITAAGKTNNGTGKSSIGFNSSLQLRAMNYNEVLAASYAGAKIINMSWAGGCFNGSYYQQVIDEAHNNGSILVAAAGNGGTCGGSNNLVYPASYNHVIAVSSVGPYDNHERSIGNPTTTHQHNYLVDICAPGYDVALSTAPGVYLTGNGSSFASPMVSGTIALMLAVNPCLSAEEVEFILKETAVNIDAMNPSYIGKLGAGRLDAAAAVQMASTFSTMTLNGEGAFDCSNMAQSITLDMSTVASPYQISWNTGDTSQTLYNVIPGNYMAIVRDSNGCIGVFTTDVDTLLPITVNADIHHVLCKNDDSGSIEIEVNGGHGFNSYLWNTGSTSQNIYNLTDGNYHVTVTDGKGCQKTEIFEVNEPAQLTSSVTHQDQIYVHSGSIDVSVSGGTLPYTFTWSNGATTEDLFELNAGFFEVLITDANGCLASANAIVNEVAVTEETSANGKGNGLINPAVGVPHLHSDLVAKSSVLGISESVESAVLIFPNPAIEFATVQWEGISIVELHVHDLTGKLIQTIQVNNQETSIRLTGITSSEYFVRMRTDNNEFIIKKVNFL